MVPLWGFLLYRETSPNALHLSGRPSCLAVPGAGQWLVVEGANLGACHSFGAFAYFTLQVPLSLPGHLPSTMASSDETQPSDLLLGPPGGSMVP